MTPTYQSGFYAPGRGVPKYPELWKGCVGAWNPGLGQSGLSLRDHSGFGNHGVLTNGPTWGVSGGRQALSFDGSNDYVVTGTITRKASFTAAIWVACDYAGSTEYARFMEHGLNESFTLCLHKYSGANSYTAQYNDGLGAFLVSTTNVSTEWTHVAMVYNASTSTAILFINGRQEASGTKAGASTVSRPMYFGGESTAAHLTSLRGQLDDARFYDRALSPNEIRLLATRPGIAYELAPRKTYFLPPSPSSQFYDVLSPSIFAGSI